MKERREHRLLMSNDERTTNRIEFFEKRSSVELAHGARGIVFYNAVVDEISDRDAGIRAGNGVDGFFIAVARASAG